MTRLEEITAYLNADRNTPQGRVIAIAKATASVEDLSQNVLSLPSRLAALRELREAPLPPPHTHLQRTIRTALWRLLRGQAAANQRRLLGFTLADLQTLPNPGSWDDPKTFTVTFKVPLTNYDLTNPEQLVEALSLDNMVILTVEQGTERRIAISKGTRRRAHHNLKAQVKQMGEASKVNIAYLISCFRNPLLEEALNAAPIEDQRVAESWLPLVHHWLAPLAAKKLKARREEEEKQEAIERQAFEANAIKRKAEQEAAQKQRLIDTEATRQARMAGSWADAYNDDFLELPKL